MTTSTLREPFTPESPYWDPDIRLDACPKWCDLTHELIALGTDDAIHSSPELEVPDETGKAGECGPLLYVEQYPDSHGGQNRYVVFEDARLTVESARIAAAELIRLADLLDATR